MACCAQALGPLMNQADLRYLLTYLSTNIRSHLLKYHELLQIFLQGDHRWSDADGREMSFTPEVEPNHLC